MSAWDFWHAHPFIAWCALWLLWGVYYLIESVLETLRVVARGWPPKENHTTHQEPEANDD